MVFTEEFARIENLDDGDTVTRKRRTHIRIAALAEICKRNLETENARYFGYREYGV